MLSATGTQCQRVNISLQTGKRQYLFLLKIKILDLAVCQWPAARREDEPRENKKDGERQPDGFGG